jgi:hypothetical protein
MPKHEGWEHQEKAASHQEKVAEHHEEKAAEHHQKAAEHHEKGNWVTNPTKGSGCQARTKCDAGATEHR